MTETMTFNGAHLTLGLVLGAVYGYMLRGEKGGAE